MDIGGESGDAGHQFLRDPRGDWANMEAESNSEWEAIAAMKED